jgi:serine/threonine-protein kinase HipA
MTDVLLVLLDGQVAGRLERARDAQPTFQYADEYVEAGTVALSARLPIQSGPFPPDRVMPYLMGLLPEATSVRERWGQRLQVAPNDAFGLLSTMGWDCPGAVQFCRPEQLDELGARSGELVAIDEAAVGERIGALVRGDATWTMPEEHWSLGGQQEKFALARSGDQWCEAHGSAATTHIIKPGIPHLRHQGLLEHLTMRAAAQVGIEVAHTQYRPFGEQWALVIERFDRHADADGFVRRVHQEDLCQATGRTPDRKYEAGGGPTAGEMLRVISRESPQLREDRLALADFMIINLVAGAPDGHSKNLSLLRLAGGSVVAPLFDLATGLAYDSDIVDRSIALSIGGERWAGRIHARQWDRAARMLGIELALLRHRATALARQFPGAFEVAATQASGAPGLTEVLERTMPRLHAHCAIILSNLA